MKTVTSTFLFAAWSLATVHASAADDVASLKDMYAVRDGDSYVVHILADGDISSFVTEREPRTSSYKLVLDVPALSPSDTKYDVETPFSRQFSVWPMLLNKKTYSRVEIWLDLEASSVVSALDASHVVIRIQRDDGTLIASNPEPEGKVVEHETEPAAVAALESTPPNDPPFSEDSDGEPAGLEPGDEELFLNLFPKPQGDQQMLFNVAPMDDSEDVDVRGIRVGRFALRPALSASYISGDNLLFESGDSERDQALLLRGRISAKLLDSLNSLELSYEGRYREFQQFEMQQRYTQIFDVATVIASSPRSEVTIKNHFVHGAFENREFDPGAEVVNNTDPFYRNFTDGKFSADVSERFGAEISGNFNRVEFLEPTTDFFSYDESAIGGGIVYNVSPLSSLVAEYVRTETRPDPTRPESRSNGDVVLVGIRGDITALLAGHIRAGFASQSFTEGATPQSFRGFVADGKLTRAFGTETALELGFGRRTSPSAFQQNGYYISNYGGARFVMPIIEKMRLTASAAYFGNSYPLGDEATGTDRADRTVSSAVGVSYFFTHLSFFSVDYRYDRRQSSLDRFDYRSNAVQFLLGFGFLN